MGWLASSLGLKGSAGAMPPRCCAMASHGPDEPGSHGVDHFLVGVRIIPPVPRGTVPTGGVGIAHPYDPARVDSHPGADGMVGLLAGLEGVGRSHAASLLRDGLPWQYERDVNEAGSLSRGERPQEAPSTHKTAPLANSCRGFCLAGTARRHGPAGIVWHFRRRAARIVPIRRANRKPGRSNPPGGLLTGFRQKRG